MKKLILMIFTVSFSTSCSQVPDFSEYQGINYIISKPFDGTFEIHWVRDDISGNYMDFTPFATVITTGLPAGTSDITRLEVFNLMTDGGFEGGIGNWTLTGTPTANILGGVLGGNTVHPDPANNSLYFDIESNERINYDFTNLTDGALFNGNYLIRFNFNRPSENLPTTFEYNDGASQYPGGIWKPKTTVSWTANGYDEFNTQTGEESLITMKAVNNIFSIGSVSISDGSQEGYLDDVKVVRTDIPLCVRATVPYQGTGIPELISGEYRFSVFIKKEIAADINPDPANPNRFPAQTLTLCINNKAEAIDISSVTDDPWVKVYTDQFVQIHEGDTISLSISPCNSTSTYLKDAGSILIASPSLEFISE